MLSEKIKWPSGCSCAVMISVNLDAEFFGKIYYPDVDVNEGDIFRLGQVSIQSILNTNLAKLVFDMDCQNMM